eukprot:4391955-Amphidinium_carterae.1
MAMSEASLAYKSRNALFLGAKSYSCSNYCLHLTDLEQAKRSSGNVGEQGAIGIMKARHSLHQPDKVLFTRGMRLSSATL